MTEEKLVCFPEEEVVKPREVIIELMDYMIVKGLTDFSGGNMALRVHNKIYSTQAHSADRFRWRLKPDNIIVTDINKNILEGRQERLSRELNLHLGILQNFSDINCTIHGNTFYSPLLVSMGIKPKAVTEIAEYHKIVEIPVLPPGIIPLSDEENNTIFSMMRELKSRGEALVVIMPLHGIIVGAEDHDKAFALFDAVESNAKFIIYQEMLKTSVLVNKVFEKILGDEGNKISNQELSQSNRPVYPSSSLHVQSTGSGSKEGSVVDFNDSSYILTAEDVIKASKSGMFKFIKVGQNCRVTDLAELKATELGLKIIKS